MTLTKARAQRLRRYYTAQSLTFVSTYVTFTYKCKSPLDLQIASSVLLYFNANKWYFNASRREGKSITTWKRALSTTCTESTRNLAMQKDIWVVFDPIKKDAYSKSLSSPSELRASDCRPSRHVPQMLVWSALQVWSFVVRQRYIEKEGEWTKKRVKGQSAKKMESHVQEQRNYFKKMQIKNTSLRFEAKA
jgi:hypothetical protein